METIGRYQLIKQIDQGGMGIVCHARDMLLGRNVALKIIGGTKEPGANDIFITNADGTNARNITNVSSIDKQCAAWFIQ